jgi:hypothetical protein
MFDPHGASTITWWLNSNWAGSRLAGSNHSRSAFIESVLRRYLFERERAAVQARDLERINRAADQLNAEAADVMEYQASVG